MKKNLSKVYLLIAVFVFLPTGVLATQSEVYQSPTHDFVEGVFADDTPTDTSKNPFTSNLKGGVEPELLRKGGGSFIFGGTDTAQGQLNPVYYVLNWVRLLLSFLGVATVGGMVYAGFLWMTGGGNAEQVTKAKKLLTNMVIGLIIITSSYSLAWFAMTRIQLATRSIGTPTIKSFHTK